MKSTVRVRFAPSPTGPLHIGGVRTALYNYLFARRHGGAFLLRIEDTDRKRYVPGAEQYIKEALTWCGLHWDEGPDGEGSHGPYRQSERMETYRDYAHRLLESSHAYWAFDTEEELDAWRQRAETAGAPPPKYDAASRMSMRNSQSLPADQVEQLLASDAPRVLRLKVPDGETIAFDDQIRGRVAFDSAEVDDKVIFKADGMPTYHLANVVDDRLMGITHVIRGEEWLSSCPLHVLLYRYLGWEAERPAFAHLPLILNPNGKGKLSKRAADKFGFPVFPLDWTDPASGDSASGFREWGFEPEAFINLLAFLGWNPGTEQELFSLEELAGVFDLDRVGKAGARFDFDKAVWFNTEHLRCMSLETLAARVRPMLDENGVDREDAWIKSFCGLYQDRVSFAQEIPVQGAYLLGPVQEYDENAVAKKYKPERADDIRALAERLGAVEPFDAGELETTLKAFLEERELGFGAVLPTLRLALAGTLSGPSVFGMMALLGREESLKRIHSGLDRFDTEVAKQR